MSDQLVFRAASSDAAWSSSVGRIRVRWSAPSDATDLRALPAQLGELFVWKTGCCARPASHEAPRAGPRQNTPRGGQPFLYTSRSWSCTEGGDGCVPHRHLRAVQSPLSQEAHQQPADLAMQHAK